MLGFLVFFPHIIYFRKFFLMEKKKGAKKAPFVILNLLTIIEQSLF